MSKPAAPVACRCKRDGCGQDLTRPPSDGKFERAVIEAGDDTGDE